MEIYNKFNFDYDQEFRDYMTANVGLAVWAKKISAAILNEFGVTVNVQISERYDLVFTGEDLALSRVYIDILEAYAAGRMTKRFRKIMGNKHTADRNKIECVIVFAD